MTTRFDDEPEFDGPDDPLAVILRPPAAHLGAPPGRYEEIRRAASRRRFVRTAAGTGVTCAVAACVALSLHLAGPSVPASPQLPLAPPAGSPTAPRHPATSPAPADPSPSPSLAPTQGRSTEPTPRTPTRSTTRTSSPARSAMPTVSGTSPDSNPSAVATSVRS
ncbi:hypothetical protein ACIRQQ_14715 [Streptomyces fuscichromogenes]|uniref:hypothetical protein n=1 Tax=Streptomyces fuscichromogenes TaxID=1324013 RepID=UPI00380D9D14